MQLRWRFLIIWIFLQWINLSLDICLEVFAIGDFPLVIPPYIRIYIYIYIYEYIYIICFFFSKTALATL